LTKSGVAALAAGPIRYFLPVYLGMVLAVAHLLHRGYGQVVNAVRSPRWSGQALPQWLTMGVVMMGLVSSNIYFQHHIW
jgi:hypothetical protein